MFYPGEIMVFQDTDENLIACDLYFRIFYILRGKAWGKASEQIFLCISFNYSFLILWGVVEVEGTLAENAASWSLGKLLTWPKTSVHVQESFFCKDCQTVALILKELYVVKFHMKWNWELDRNLQKEKSWLKYRVVDYYAKDRICSSASAAFHNCSFSQ